MIQLLGMWTKRSGRFYKDYCWVNLFRGTANIWIIWSLSLGRWLLGGKVWYWTWNIIHFHFTTGASTIFEIISFNFGYFTKNWCRIASCENKVNRARRKYLPRKNTTPPIVMPKIIPKIDVAMYTNAIAKTIFVDKTSVDFSLVFIL